MNTHDSNVPTTPGPRQFLGAALLTAGLLPLAACTTRPSRSPASPSASASVSASEYAAAIQAAEAKRPHSGATRSYTLSARQGTVDLGGRTARTWLYDEAVPGKTLRAKVGDELAITLNNQLAVNTSIHWHGIAIRNDMDGVVPPTPDVAQGSSRTYRFTALHPGTYWYHPHVGVQADYGLYGPLIIDDPAEPGAHDREWIIVLDDWTDGVGDSPDQILARLRGMGSGTPSMSGMPSISGMPSTQPWRLDVPLPQRIPPGRRDDDPRRLPALTRGHSALDEDITDPWRCAAMSIGTSAGQVPETGIVSGDLDRVSPQHGRSGAWSALGMSAERAARSEVDGGANTGSH